MVLACAFMAFLRVIVLVCLREVGFAPSLSLSLSFSLSLCGGGWGVGGLRVGCLHPNGVGTNGVIQNFL